MVEANDVDLGFSGDLGDDITADAEMNLPKRYGWSVKMDHKFPETWDSILIPRIKQLPDLLPLFIRYLIWWIKTRLFRRVKPFIDCLSTLNGKQIYGVPIGGIGSGTIGRGFRGEFCRFQMTPGIYSYHIVDANQFILSVRNKKGMSIYQKVLTGSGKPGKLSSWDWSFNPKNGSYIGLYPRAWYTYHIPELNLILQCKQISPVIPHNYVDSCFPCAVFVWEVINNGHEDLSISLTFTFKNGTGAKTDKSGSCSSQTFSGKKENFTVKGVALEHNIENIKTTYGIGCLEKANQSVTFLNQFDLRTGSDLWQKLISKGKLDAESCSYDLTKGEMGIAVNCSTEVPANNKTEISFCLTWHQPCIMFKEKQAVHTRRYVRFLQSDNHNNEEKPTTTAVRNLTTYSLMNYPNWEKGIDKWQIPILSEQKLPAWFKSALFNESYFLSDGGSVWIEYDEALLPNSTSKGNQIRKEYGRFGYLEAHEYRMYNTYDVHFYASFALSHLFPNLQESLQYDTADSVLFKDDTIRTHLFDGHRSARKQANCVPHDLGDPAEDPFLKINSYLMHDITNWRDLNLKFVLQVYRDWETNKNQVYLQEMLPICVEVMKKSITWDLDGDGLIENSGSADQTYDTWIMRGPSSYCGSLWLGSLYAIISMLRSSTIEGKEFQIKEYQDILNRGKISFQEKLWNGNYYKFDCSGRPHGNSIMSDQLCGHWFLAMCGADDSDIFPPANVSKALNTIFTNNVLGIRNGSMGAINGMMPDGQLDTFTIQSEETWTGVSYAVAAAMIYHGMTDEGFKTAEGIYKTVYEKIGMGFETPEALMHTKKYRAIGYMRALSIWSILIAYKIRQSKTGDN